MTMRFVGRDGALAHFQDGSVDVVVDTDAGEVVPIPADCRVWVPGEFTNEELSIARSYVETQLALANAKAGRRYTIPRALQQKAASALTLGVEPATPALAYYSALLADGGQIDRHAVDALRRKQGLEPFVDDEGKAWLEGLKIDEPPHEVEGGYLPDDEDEEPTDEFFVRIDEDNHIDRLYFIKDGVPYVWDGEDWDSLGLDPAERDLWQMDARLDGSLDPETAEPGLYDHLPIDAGSGVVIARHLTANPHQTIPVEAINDEEARLALLALMDPTEDADFEFRMARSIMAAGAVPNNDDYDSQERSKNASKQVRDKNGKFAKMGSRVVIGGNPQTGIGNISRLNPETGTVTVTLDSGADVDVPGESIESADLYANETASTDAEATPTTARVDTTGILRKPSPPKKQPVAMLPPNASVLPSADIHHLLEDYPAWVKQQRESSGDSKRPNLHPLVEKWQGYSKRTASRVDVDLNPLQAAAPAPAGPVTDGPAEVAPPAEGTPPAPAPAPAAEETPAPEASEAPAEPENRAPDSDVQPVYLAFVDDKNLRAVMKLVALIPESGESTSPAAYQRDGGKWVPDPEALADLRSATPPPVVPLAEDMLNDVLTQIDTTHGVLTAAGGLDRNRGGAEHLRRYWTIGRGAAKIRWGTPGDWRRCVRNLSKYLGVRAKGYCSNRHKEMTGVWPGDRKNLTSSVVEASFLYAARETARARVRGALTAASAPETTGAKFRIPVLVPADSWTDDKRMFKGSGLQHRELPLTLMWQVQTAEGHNQALAVGRIDSIDVLEDGSLGNAIGFFDVSPAGREAERLVRNKIVRGVSADLGGAELAEEDEEDEEKQTFTKAKVLAATIVTRPAFEQSTIEILDETTPIETNDPKEPAVDTRAALTASASIASAIPVEPPSEWFANPHLSGPTPLTVTDEGRVFGHIATWSRSHIGLPTTTNPPRSRSGYAFFHTGVVRTREGKDINVGQLTLTGGHAGLEASADAAKAHYDETGSALADVHAGEDRYGIYVSGALRPGVTPEQVRAFRASAPSGDWRPIDGRLELVAVCQVNVPGFPIARGFVAAAGAGVSALVAAGTQELVRMKREEIALLEENPAITAAAIRIQEAKNARAAKIAAKASALTAAMKAKVGDRLTTKDERKAWAEAGISMPDGSYAIYDQGSLDRAIDRFSLSAEQPGVVVKHIKRRAKVLGLTASIPADWNALASTRQGRIAERMRAAIVAAGEKDREREQRVGADRVGEEQRPTRTQAFKPGIDQPRDWHGRFTPVLAVLRETDEFPTEADRPVAELDALEESATDEEAAQHAMNLMATLDQIDAEHISQNSVDALRRSSKLLALTVANMPIPVSGPNETASWSDLPPVLKSFAESLVARIEAEVEDPEGRENALAQIKDLMSGADKYTRSEITSMLVRMVHALN